MRHEERPSLHPARAITPRREVRCPAPRMTVTSLRPAELRPLRRRRRARPIIFSATNRSRCREFTPRLSVRARNSRFLEAERKFRATESSAPSPSAFVLVLERSLNLSRRRVLRRCPQSTRSPVRTTQRHSASPHHAPPPPLPFRSSRAKPHLPTHYVLPPLYFL